MQHYPNQTLAQPNPTQPETQQNPTQSDSIRPKPNPTQPQHNQNFNLNRNPTNHQPDQTPSQLQPKPNRTKPDPIPNRPKSNPIKLNSTHHQLSSTPICPTPTQLNKIKSKPGKGKRNFSAESPIFAGFSRQTPTLPQTNPNPNPTPTQLNTTKPSQNPIPTPFRARNFH